MLPGADRCNREPQVLEVTCKGPTLLNTPLLNKGSAFSQAERHELGLVGLIPPYVATLDEQVIQAYQNYCRKTTDLERYIFLSSLQDRNETLFYRLVHEHIAEMTPIIYTPVVGIASQEYSHIFRRPRGVYIPYTQRDQIDTILQNTGIRDVRVIVVTDGERILGLGDLGVGGIGISIGKLALYTLCAGIHPATTLPIVLDVGTDNQRLLDDPLYLGWRHARIRGGDYDAFIGAFVSAVERQFPGVLLQWEDFSNRNAGPILERYRERLCTFNDDIQGTGAVTLAGLLAAVACSGSCLADQRIVLFGAGSAASGIAEQIVMTLVSEGLSEAAARSRIWLVDSRGLVHANRAGLDAFKQAYAQSHAPLGTWQVANVDRISLEDVVQHVRPTVLIGTAAQPGSFTEVVVRAMARHVERPIIFPLSNPTSQCEANPADLLAWTEGRALIATGSPFAHVAYDGVQRHIGQCNNAFIFPGVGLGVLASQAWSVTTEMFEAAARALSDGSPIRADPHAPLYPRLETIRDVSRHVALAVALEAQRVGLAAPTTAEILQQRIMDLMWMPQYAELRYAHG